MEILQIHYAHGVPLGFNTIQRNQPALTGTDRSLLFVSIVWLPLRQALSSNPIYYKRRNLIKSTALSPTRPLAVGSIQAQYERR